MYFWLIFSNTLLLSAYVYKIQHHYSLQSFLRVDPFTLVEITEWKWWENKFCGKVLIKGTLKISNAALGINFWGLSSLISNPCFKHFYLGLLQKTELPSSSTKSPTGSEFAKTSMSWTSRKKTLFALVMLNLSVRAISGEWWSYWPANSSLLTNR